ncbi:unnamed protein product [Rhizophagus irregularis]|nr:unnamed protein product [Rhizophagus irregularis]CAB5370488.1 unnamed protein product [Rhizophagus irregularis]
MVHSIWVCPELEHAYEIEKNSKISTSESNRLTYLLECLRKYDEDNQTKMLESSAKLQDTSLSSIKASNIPTEIVSSDSNESASNKRTEIVSSDSNESGKKEQTLKISELNTKLQDTSSLFIKASIKPTGFVSSDDESSKEQTSKVPESSAKLQDTSSSLFIKDFRNKPTGFDHQPSKKKSKMPEKSKKSSSIKVSNKSTEVISSNDESHQPKKNSKNSKKKSKSKKSKKQRK